MNDEVMEQLKKDPFIKLWEGNFNQNYLSGLLEAKRSKPLNYLVNTKPYSQIPVVLVVAGPSLDTNIEYLKDYQNNCVIICADICLFKLLENNIKPDFVCTIDPHEISKSFYTDLKTEDLTLVCPTTSNPTGLNEWKGNILFYNQEDYKGSPKDIALKKMLKPIEGWHTLFNRFFVGATMFQIASLMNPTEIILVGYDFSYRDKKPYCDGVLKRRSKWEIETIYKDFERTYSDEEFITRRTQENTDFEYNQKNLEIDKNGITWETKNNLKLYKDVFVELILKSGLTVINSTEGGIMTHCPERSLKQSLELYCKNVIKKVDIFNYVPKRRGRR